MIIPQFDDYQLTEFEWNTELQKCLVPYTKIAQKNHRIQCTCCSVSCCNPGNSSCPPSVQPRDVISCAAWNVSMQMVIALHLVPLCTKNKKYRSESNATCCSCPENTQSPEPFERKRRKFNSKEISLYWRDIVSDFISVPLLLLIQIRRGSNSFSVLCVAASLVVVVVLVYCPPLQSDYTSSMHTLGSWQSPLFLC